MFKLGSGNISNSDEPKKKIIQPSVLFGCSQISLAGSAMDAGS